MRIMLADETQVMVLPIVPPNLIIPSNTRDVTEITLLNIGKVSIQGEKKLRDFTINSFFPNRKYDYADSQSSTNGWDYIDFIQKTIDNKFPITLVISTDEKELLNMRCIITDFTHNLDRAGDINYTLTLKEYKRILI